LIKTTQIQDLESEIGGARSSRARWRQINDVDRRVMKLQEEVLEHLSNIQRGLKV
jgi:hypothetical protein